MVWLACTYGLRFTRLLIESVYSVPEIFRVLYSLLLVYHILMLSRNEQKFWACLTRKKNSYKANSLVPHSYLDTGIWAETFSH